MQGAASFSESGCLKVPDGAVRRDAPWAGNCRWELRQVVLAVGPDGIAAEEPEPYRAIRSILLAGDDHLFPPAPIAWFVDQFAEASRRGWFNIEVIDVFLSVVTDALRLACPGVWAGESWRGYRDDLRSIFLCGFFSAVFVLQEDRNEQGSHKNKEYQLQQSARIQSAITD